MTKEVYDSLSEKERVMYNELTEFSKRLAERMGEVLELLQAILAEAHDPS